MPQYDPKANRPSLVRVESEAPVDHLLGPMPDRAPTTDRPERPLRVVADPPPAPDPGVSHRDATPLPAEASRRTRSGLSSRGAIIALVGLVTAVGIVIVVRQR